MRILIAVLALTLAGCETTKLWQNGADDEYVKVVPQHPEEDVEAALKASGRKYQCETVHYTAQPDIKTCYAELTGEEKRKEIGIKLLKTPETIASDAGNTIKVVGYVLLKAIMVSGYHN